MIIFYQVNWIKTTHPVPPSSPLLPLPSLFRSLRFSILLLPSTPCYFLLPLAPQCLPLAPIPPSPFLSLALLHPSPPFLPLLFPPPSPLIASSSPSAPQDSQHPASGVPVGSRAAGGPRVCCPGRPPLRHPHLDQDLRAGHLHHAAAGPRKCPAPHL